MRTHHDVVKFVAYFTEVPESTQTILLWSVRISSNFNRKIIGWKSQFGNFGNLYIYILIYLFIIIHIFIIYLLYNHKIEIFSPCARLWLRSPDVERNYFFQKDMHFQNFLFLATEQQLKKITQKLLLKIVFIDFKSSNKLGLTIYAPDRYQHQINRQKILFWTTRAFSFSKRVQKLNFVFLLVE